MKRWISSLLIAALLLGLFSFPGFAAEEVSPELQYLSVITDKNGVQAQKTIPVAVVGEELYTSSQSLAELTRYSLTSDETRIAFQLGMKIVLVDCEAQSLSVNSKEQSFTGTLTVAGETFLPMSELLPWLNVQCYISEGQLHMDSDLLSYWEVADDFSTEEYVFDFVEAYGTDAMDTFSLCMINVFDSILNLGSLWKRAIRIGDGETSIYAYEIHKECFREFALPEEGTEAAVQKSVSELSNKVSTASQLTNAAYEGLYSEEMQEKLSELYGEDLLGEGLPSGENTTNETLKLAAKALKYLKTGYIYVRIAATDTSDYADALRYIYLQGDGTVPGGIELAASEAVAALSSATAAGIDGAATIFADLGTSYLEKSVETTVEMAAEETILSSLGLYLDMIDAGLSLVWPINEAYGELSKMAVYQGIQYDAINAFYSIPRYRENVSPEQIMLGRTTALIFLRTAKKCYKAQQQTFDLFNGEGVLDFTVSKLDRKILEFQLSALAQKRDAICDKSAEQQLLRELWAAVKLSSGEEIPNTPSEEVRSGLLPELLGYWSVCMSGVYSPHKQENWMEVEEFTVCFMEDGRISIWQCFSQSDVFFKGCNGTWTAEEQADRYLIRMNLQEEGETTEFQATMELRLEGDRFTVLQVSSPKTCVLEGETYMKDYSSYYWEQEINSGNVQRICTWYYSMTIPESWLGEYYIEWSDVAEISFGHRASREYRDQYYPDSAEAGGHLFFLRVVRQEDNNLPDYDLLGYLTIEGEQYQLIAVYPSAIMHPLETSEAYSVLFRDIPLLLATIEPRNGASFTPAYPAEE